MALLLCLQLPELFVCYTQHVINPQACAHHHVSVACIVTDDLRSFDTVFAMVVYVLSAFGEMCYVKDNSVYAAVR